MQKPLTAFTTDFHRRSKVLVNEVHISQPITSLSQQSPPAGMPKDAKKYLAIWDTGATGSVITKKVVDDCGLKPIGMAKVHHAQGVETTPVYLVSIVLPNKVIVPSLRVTEGKLVGNVEVLIGMDIIGLGDFAVSNKDGVTVFSYRTPSIERIDFVQQLNNASKPNSPPTYSKIGRNAPCPCGSGKKYKNCHGR